MHVFGRKGLAGRGNGPCASLEGRVLGMCGQDGTALCPQGAELETEC